MKLKQVSRRKQEMLEWRVHGTEAANYKLWEVTGKMRVS